jgi:nitrate/TMAO reductase-like tetraheme cytochrome c subunit
VDCIKCHANGYSNTSSECVSCHQTNYNNAINPNHAVNKFSTDCKTCHNVKAWQPSTFNHATTSFPLTGLHAGVDCVSCHTKGYKLGDTPTRCEDCHIAKAVTTTNPNHTAANFLTSCETCHTTSGWLPSKYVHPTTFKLTGGHGGLTCNNCHSKGYTSTSTACVSCHQADYNATKSPAHATSGFSTACTSCHTTTAWIPSTFNHETYFPIKTGKHTGLACTECHKNAANYKVFVCTDCHEHNKTDMDKEHRGKSGYVYNSTNCYSCHPRGKG